MYDVVNKFTNNNLVSNNKSRRQSKDPSGLRPSTSQTLQKHNVEGRPSFVLGCDSVKRLIIARNKAILMYDFNEI